MKRIAGALFALMMVLTMFGVSAPPVQAQAEPPRSSTINVLNLSNEAGQLTLTYYNQDGTLATMETGYTNPQNDTINANAMNAYNPVRAASGFNGSVVVASSVPIAIVSNVTYDSTAQGIGSYNGVSVGASKIYFPSLQKGNSQQDTLINIQNAGEADVTIQINFGPEAGYATVTPINDTIKKGAAHTYDLKTLAQFSAITKWVGSATVTVTSATGSVAGVAVTRKSTNPNAYGVYAYNAFSKGSTTVIAPLIQEANNGNRTSINCQNISPDATTTVSVAYTPEPGNPAKPAESKANIGPGEPAVFVQNETGTKFVGSATITSNPAVPLVCVINQQKRSVGRMSSYEGFDPADATTSVVLPLIQSKNGNVSKGYVYTTVNASTADGTSGNFTLDFKPETGISDVSNETKAGAVAVFDQRTLVSVPNKFVGGAVLTCDKPIFVVVNMNREAAPQPYRDPYSSYDGFNVAP